MQNKDFFLWGHSLSQYEAMFDLNQPALQKNIIDCASGFALFNREMNDQGKKVISCDPAYDLPMPQLQEHLEQGLQNLVNYFNQHPQQFISPGKKTIDHLAEQNEQMIKKFLFDFPLGKEEGRYVSAALPELPFADQQFDLALCAYFLFSSKAFSQAFHLAVIKEMCRVAGEARIYPILDSEGEMPQQLPLIILQLQQENYGVEIKQVKYEVQKGSNAMLRVWAQGCKINIDEK